MATPLEPTRALPYRWVRTWLLLAVPVTLTALTVVLALRTGSTATLFTLLPSTAAIGVVGGLLAGLRPRYAGGWLMLATGIAFLLGQLAEQVAVGAQSDTVAVNAAWVGTWIYQPALVLMFVLVPLTFPDGRLPSPRWRGLVVASALILVAVVLAGAFLSPTLAPVDDQTRPNPYALPDTAASTTVPHVLAWATLAAAVLATASLVARWRAADRVVRRQILWVVLALAVLACAFVVDAAVAHLLPTAYPSVFPVIQLVPIVVPVAVVVAVLRYQLFDIEVLVGRTLVYGLVTGALVVVYAVIVAASGAALPSADEGVGRVLAVAVVAVAFAPLRDVLQSMVGRWLFGDRAQPHAALIRISEEVSSRATPAELRATLAAAVARSLRSPYACLAFDTDGQLTDGVEHGVRPTSPDQLVTVDLQHGGERVGQLLVARRGNEAYTPADRRLLDTLALPIAGALHALRLSEQVRLSREVLLRSVEEERRRLGNDLHDSLGPRLAAIGMQAEAAADVLRTDPDRAVAILAGVLDQTDHALGEARGIAHAHRPPTLDTLGLVATLETLLGHLTSVPATVVAEALPPLPAAVETAAYRIASEALHNVARHSGAGSCVVRIGHDGSRLALCVEDDGRGMPQRSAPGLGLVSMRERAEELGGTLTVTTGAEGSGTRILAVLPCAAPAAHEPEHVGGRG